MRFSSCLLVSLAACAGPDLEVDPQLVVGTGETEFEPLSADQVTDTPIAYGVQGGQHIWVSLRAIGIDWRTGMVTLELADEAGLAATEPSTNEVRMKACPLTSDGCERGWGEIVGLTLVLTDASAVLGFDLDLHATLTDEEGRTDEASVIVRPTVP